MRLLPAAERARGRLALDFDGAVTARARCQLRGRRRHRMRAIALYDASHLGKERGIINAAPPLPPPRRGRGGRRRRLCCRLERSEGLNQRRDLDLDRRRIGARPRTSIRSRIKCLSSAPACQMILSALAAISAVCQNARGEAGTATPSGVLRRALTLPATRARARRAFMPSPPIMASASRIGVHLMLAPSAEAQSAGLESCAAAGADVRCSGSRP